MHDERAPAAGAANRRRGLLAMFAALAAASGAASAQMAGGRRGGTRSSDDSQDKPRADCPKPEPVLPRDVMTVFAGRLKDTSADLAIRPAQARAFEEFVACAAEVGQHNARWLEKTLAQGVGTTSAAEPLRSFIAAEAADGDDRAQALQDLQARHAALVALLDDRQRAALSSLFAVVRSDLRADSRG